eukprot:jgi/Botrbrau1/2677/Bobra.0203s0022.2
MLPADLLSLFAAMLIGIDLASFRVAFKLPPEEVEVAVWDRNTFALLTDPITQYWVRTLHVLRQPPRCFFAQLTRFRHLSTMSLHSIEDVLAMGEICPPKLINLRLFDCIICAKDLKPPRALRSLYLYDCKVFLGPPGQQWPLLACADAAIFKCDFRYCEFHDEFETGAWPLSSPSLEILRLQCCEFLTSCKETNLFYPISRSLENATLWVDYGDDDSNSLLDMYEGRDLDPGAHPNFLISGFWRNVAPQLTNLAFINAPHLCTFANWTRLAKLNSLSLRPSAVWRRNHHCMQCQTCLCSFAVKEGETSKESENNKESNNDKEEEEIDDDEDKDSKGRYCPCTIQQYPQGLSYLRLTCPKCCGEHMLHGIASSARAAGQLTSLRLGLDYHGTSRGPAASPNSLLPFTSLIRIHGDSLAASNVVELLLASRACGQLEYICLNLASVESGTACQPRADEAIELRNGKLRIVKIPWVFSHLDVRECANLTHLGITAVCAGLEGASRTGSCVAVPLPAGQWAKAKDISGCWEGPEIHWHAKDTASSTKTPPKCCSDKWSDVVSIV